MSTNDIFQSIGSLGPEGVQKIVDRLEFRGRDPIFVAMRERYLDRMDLGTCRSLLDLGCGTGVVTRALAGRDGFPGAITGVDFSPELIDAAAGLAVDEGLDDRITFRTGDSHALPDADDNYDIVLAHTLVSHVSDVDAVIAEAARVTKPGGAIAIFDGDYASIVFGSGDHTRNAGVVREMLDTVVANPHVLREMPAILARHGLEMTGFMPEVLAEAGQASFFAGMIDSYIPMTVKAGRLREEAAADWLAEQSAASEAGSFFASCNYYTYLARKG